MAKAYNDPAMILPLLAPTNIDATIAFFTEKLGFSLQFTMPGENGISFAMLGWGDKVTIGLTADTAAYERGKGVVFMIYVPDGTNVDDHHAFATANGANPSPLEDAYWGDRCFNVITPDGYVLVICQTIKVMTPDEVIANSASN